MIAVHPLGGCFTVLPSRLRQDTNRSPLTVPAGLSIVRRLSADVLLAVDCRTIPGAGGAVTVIVFVLVLVPPAFVTVSVTV